MRVGIDFTAAATQRAGIGRATRDLTTALLKLPERPELRLLYAHRGPIRWVDALSTYDRVRVRRLPASPRIALAAWHKLRLPLPVEAFIGPVHVFHGPDFTLPPRIAAPGVVTVHDLSFVTRPQDAHPAQRRFLEQAVPRSIDRARLVVAVSESTKRDLMQRLGVRPHRIRVVPNAVSAEFAAVTDSDQLAAVRRKLDLPDEFLVSVGTIHPRKNLGGLATALEIVSRRIGRRVPAIHVGGEGWLVDRVYDQVRAAGDDAVRFVGHVDEATLRALYTLARGLVYPSFVEGFGLPILEAFACECPVVTSNRSGMDEVAGGAAILIDPDDPESIATGIIEVLDNDERREELRRLGRERRDVYSWRRSAGALLMAYREASRGEPRPNADD